MARSGRSRGRRFGIGRRSSRKTRWTGSIFQGDVIFDTAINDNLTWVSLWSKWPAGHFDPFTTDVAESDPPRLEPSDETLVNTITNLTFVYAPNETPGASTVATNVAFGLIAFDGGQFPEYYEGAAYDFTALVAPPNPAIDLQEDWLWRMEIGGLFTRSTGSNGTDRLQQVKSMRKLPPDTGILAVVGLCDLASSTAVQELKWNWTTHHAVRSGYTA